MYRRTIIVIITAWSASAFAGTCNVVNGKTYGVCKEVNVNTGQKGKLVIATSVTESGMIAGAVVKRGGSLKLSGMSVGDITIETGGSLEVSGTVNGSITNNGGKVQINGTARSVRMNSGSLEISGMVDSLSGSGTITFQKGAVIGGKPVQ